MGMSHFGEISRLSMCACPTCAVITNIGVSHIENLGTQENILKAKLEILDGADYDAPLILCKDDKLLAGAEIHGERRVVYYSVKRRTVRFTLRILKLTNRRYPLQLIITKEGSEPLYIALESIT